MKKHNTTTSKWDKLTEKQKRAIYEGTIVPSHIPKTDGFIFSQTRKTKPKLVSRIAKELSDTTL